MAAVCQHVDPTIACETFWQHQYKQQQRSKAASAACVCVCAYYCCCCYLCYFSEFLPCLCVTNTLAQQKTAARRWRRRLSAIPTATATLVWSGLVSYSSSLATLRSALLLFRFTLSFATFCAVRSCLLQCLRCGRVFSLMLPLSAASASCQVILLFLS